MSAKDKKGPSKPPRSPSSSPSYTDSDNESMPEIECKLCGKTLTNMKQYQEHIHSKKHTKAVFNKNKGNAESNINKLFSGLSGGPISDDEEKLVLNCEVCDMTFSGFMPYSAHLNGSTHAKNLKKQELKKIMKDIEGLELIGSEGSDDDGMPKVVAKCTNCNKEFTSLESYQKHLAGLAHKEKLKNEKILNTERKKEENKGSDGEISNDFFKKCEVCEKEFSGLQPYRIHMRSLVHKKGLKKIEVENKIKPLLTEQSSDRNYVCKDCMHVFTDVFAFQLHIDKNSHKKYEAKRQINDLINTYPEIVTTKTIQNNEEDSDEASEYRVGDYVLVCKLCHTSFCGPESALDHVKSKKHVKAKQTKAALKLISQKATQDGDKPKEKSESGARKSEQNEGDFEHL